MRLRHIRVAIMLLLVATPVIAQTKTDTASVQSTYLTAQSVTPSTLPPAIVSGRFSSSTAAPSWVNALTVTPSSPAPMVSARETDSGHTTRNSALMIVGAAGIVAGTAVRGNAGTVFVVGGTIVGLYGLWNYLK